MSDQQRPRNYYHYTDARGAKGIDREGVIYPSHPGNGDAAYGGGTYLTSLQPSTDKPTLTWNNYDDGSSFRQGLQRKTNYFVEIPSKDLPGVQKVWNPQNRDIYHYPGAVPLTENSRIAKTPTQKKQ